MFLPGLLLVLALGTALEAQAAEIPYSASNAYMDAQPSDGLFDDGVSVNDASTAWWPVFGGTGNNLWRPAFEFDLSGLGSVSSSSLTVTYDFVRFRATEIELHGYAGDGVVTRSDVLFDNLLGARALPEKASLPLIDLTFDVTNFVRSLVDSGEPYAGFSIRLADEGFDGELLTNIWTGRIDTPTGDGLGRGPRLSVTAVPAPATLALALLGIAGMTHRSLRLGKS